jgi:hypothetical protein
VLLPDAGITRCSSLDGLGASLTCDCGARKPLSNKLDQVYTKLRGRKLCGLEAQRFDGVMIQEVIRHRLGVPEHQHPYFDDVDMVGPGEETILEAALGGAYTIDDLIEVSRPHLKGH